MDIEMYIMTLEDLIRKRCKCHHCDGKGYWLFTDPKNDVWNEKRPCTLCNETGLDDEARIILAQNPL